MRSSILLYTVITPVLVGSAASQLLPFQLFSKQRKNASETAQRPIMNPSHIPTPPSSGDNPSSNPSGSVILSDIIGRDRSINIFAGLTRDIDSVASRLDDSSLNATVLAPLNAEITKLPRKPWEDLWDYAALGTNAYEGAMGAERAQKNLRRFVEAHIVPQSPWKEGQRVRTMAGQEVWWQVEDGKKVVSVPNFVAKIAA